MDGNSANGLVALAGALVSRVLMRLRETPALPAVIQSDNGPELSRSRDG
jgi:hypothetical protein